MPCSNYPSQVLEINLELIYDNFYERLLIENNTFICPL